MRTVGIKTLKNRLSEYIRLVAAGEMIMVTDRRRVVAEIVPPRPELQRLTADLFLAQGLREGWLRPAANSASGPPPRYPIVPFDQLMQELDRDREDR